MLIDLVNILTLLMAFSCLIVAVMTYRMTKAHALLALVGAFGWAFMVRIGIALDISWLKDNSQPLTFVTFAFFTVALILLYRELTKVYREIR